MKIPTEDFSNVTLAIDDTYGDWLMGVVDMEVDMEVDKMADDVSDILADRSDFTDVTLVSEDNY